jgi:hypothetical protein
VKQSVSKRVVIVVSLALLGCLVGCDGRRVPVTEFNQGFNSGVESVREIRQKQGVLGDMGMKAGAGLGLIPAKPDKSPDWNAGFRQGVQSELKH